MEENKQKICDLLSKALIETRGGSNISGIRYINDTEKNMEFAVVMFMGGGSRHINVTCDSGVAMIRDIMKNLGV